MVELVILLFVVLAVACFGLLLPFLRLLPLCQSLRRCRRRPPAMFPMASVAAMATIRVMLRFMMCSFVWLLNANCG